MQDYQYIVDISVACSKSEGMPVNIVEAMLSGTTVVTSNNRGHRELVKSEHTGYLVDCGDISAMAQKTGLILSDTVLTNQLTDSAKRHITPYIKSAVKKELEQIYFS